MTDHASVPAGATSKSAPINWAAAVFGAAAIGGIAYGILARAFSDRRTSSEGGIVGWLPVGVVTIGLLVCGLFGLLYFSRTSRLRTFAAAIAAAPATGGLIALEIFVVWMVSQYVCSSIFNAD